jgi:hypothetical protein
MTTLEAIKPYVEQLLDDNEVQRNFARAAHNLRGAKMRADRAKSKKRAVADPELYQRLLSSVGAALDAGVAIKNGPQKARRRKRGRWLLLLAVAGGAAYVATNDDARTKLLELAGQKSQTAEAA